MRNIMNISLPETMVKTIKQEVKRGGFASNSEFFRHLIRLWEAENLRKDREEFKKGKGILLKSIRDIR